MCLHASLGMRSESTSNTVLVTGAGGQIGSRLSALLRAAGHRVLAVDMRANARENVEPCDISRDDQLARLFDSASIRTVIHLAAILPTAFRADPITGTEVNLTSTLRLLREARAHQVDRFVFGSSMSVYGSSARSGALSEHNVTAPDDPYGVAKRAVELAGESLAVTTGFGFVALRIARVVGPGAKSTASSWRSQILEPFASAGQGPILIPFAPAARLCLAHVDEVARMLTILAGAAEIPRRLYNSPAEVWEARDLAGLVERVRRVPVRLGEAHGGPISDGTLFTQDFSFRLRGLADYLASSRGLTSA
jgi:nucleoside-diphosphate-sugar epimerase